MHDYAQFEKRIASVTTKHRQMARGYTAKIGNDGLILVEPKAQRSLFGFRIFLCVVFVILLVKSLMITSVGLATYQNRLDALATGTSFEQAVAWGMQPDAVSRYLAENFTKLIP